MRVWSRTVSLGLVLIFALSALPVAPASGSTQTVSEHASGTGTASACITLREHGVTLCRPDVVTFAYAATGDWLSVTISGRQSFGDCSGNTATEEFTGSVTFGMTLDCVAASASAVSLLPVETGHCKIRVHMAGEDATFGVSITAEGFGPCTLA